MGTDFVIEEGASDVVLPRIAPSAPWFYCHHPIAGWAILGGELRPVLVQTPVEPGILGAPEGSARAAKSAVRVEMESRGFRAISETASMPAGQSYMQRHQVRGGVAYVPRWMRLIPGSERWTTDEAGYHAWLDRLIADGHIAPPAPYVVERLVEQLESRLSDLTSRAQSAPGLAPRVEVAAAHLASARRALARLLDGVDSVPGDAFSIDDGDDDGQEHGPPPAGADGKAARAPRAARREV